jgi:hypothetical protein
MSLERAQIEVNEARKGPQKVLARSWDGGRDAPGPNKVKKKRLRLGAVAWTQRKSFRNAVERSYFQAIWLRIELAMSGGREEV